MSKKESVFFYIEKNIDDFFMVIGKWLQKKS